MLCEGPCTRLKRQYRLRLLRCGDGLCHPRAASLTPQPLLAKHPEGRFLDSSVPKAGSPSLAMTQVRPPTSFHVTARTLSRLRAVSVACVRGVGWVLDSTVQCSVSHIFAA